MKLSVIKKESTMFLLCFSSTMIFSEYLKGMCKKTHKAFASLPDEQRQLLEIRDYALSGNSFYNSENPMLRQVAIAAYQQDEQLQAKSKILYLKHLQLKKKSNLMVDKTPSEQLNFFK